MVSNYDKYMIIDLLEKIKRHPKKYSKNRGKHKNMFHSLQISYKTNNDNTDKKYEDND